MCRVVTEYRWNADLVLKIAGTPMKPNPTLDGDEGDAWVEDSANPHEPIDLDVGILDPVWKNHCATSYVPMVKCPW